jgi:hypothetical protein
MDTFRDVYSTPEQIATQLQVVTATVYRWLRSGKLQGTRISPKAWRVAPRDLDIFLKRQNLSELLFEEYLQGQGLGQPDHEPQVAGKSTRLDYRVSFSGKTLWFEVKQFAEVDLGDGGPYDPYISIRKKIAKAAAQFSEYKGECCSIVLYNDAINLAQISTPEIVLGAMLGNISIRVPVNFETGEETGPATTFFSEGGKLIHPHLKTPQNTTVGSVIALEKLPLGRREFQIKLAQKEATEERRLPWEEFHNLFQEDLDANTRTVLRTIVYENPYAAMTLPPDIFTGPFDERWGPLPEHNYIKRVYVGSELQKLEEGERGLGLDLGPLQKLIKRSDSKRQQRLGGG